MLATLLANKMQHCWAQHVVSVCTPCCVLLRVVATCWMKFDQFQTSSNNFQQVTKNTQHGVQTLTTCWAQQCCILLANNVASICTAWRGLTITTRTLCIAGKLTNCNVYSNTVVTISPDTNALYINTEILPMYSCRVIWYIEDNITMTS